MNVLSVISGPIYRAEFPTQSEEYADTASKILSFENLKAGWNYGEGGPISKSVIDTALAIYWHLQVLDFEETDAFPGIDGEIMVTAYRGNHYIESIVEIDGSISLQYEEADTEIYSEAGLTLVEALEKLSEISKLTLAGGTWSTYVSYIENTLIPTQSKTDLKAWLSKIPPTVGAPPSSSWTVSVGGAGQYVITLAGITHPTSLTTLPFSGNLIAQSYRLKVK